MLAKKSLTSKQKLVYSKLREHLEKNKESPTLEELRRSAGVGSINTIVQRLTALEQKGFIIRRKHSKRNIELRNMDPESFSSSTISIPVVASVGCDDLSVFSEHKHDESIDIDRKLVQGKGNVVAVRAVGDSMNDADIHNGDYVLIEVTDQAKNGDRVAPIIGDMVTVKKYEKKDDLVILRPESKDPKYKPIVMSEDFKIAGKVIRSIPGESMDITEVVPIREN